MSGGGGGSGLATELDRLLEMARELEARVERGSPATARDLCAALTASVDNAVRLAGTGTPRGGGAIAAASGKAGRKRGAMEKVRRQVRVSSVHDLAPLDDGLSWRKYGQKDILGAKYPRAYFRCTHRNTQGCQATKQVQRDAGDPLIFDVVYHGDHTCAQGLQHLQRHDQRQTAAAAAGQEQQQQDEGLPVGAGGMQWPLDMGFEAQLDELLFLDPSEFLQPGFQNL
ncbi:probable WRKY transcription factor 41 [Brachypodium distachyon]|uniref:WRKY domain-containing protein n=1 Tax=Brachypodium distachyon TaxID=15368 RepID=I1HG78_BRADI|nr:probable WRKY transcription factor 41 [Brachypodium distachyon]KQK04778.1 hypothetical protein BRADI_2g15877v3 [Brachypodium distachyon]|eukprot:XP_003565888.1 probable WRKY transcription factor 41 [Brachypodium distachyon]